MARGERPLRSQVRGHPESSDCATTVPIGIEKWESLRFPKTRIAGRLCRAGELAVQRLVILDMPIFDNQPVGDPHDVGRQIVDRLPGSFCTFAGPREGARDAKVADDTIPDQHLLVNLYPTIWKRIEEGRPGIGQT